MHAHYGNGTFFVYVSAKEGSNIVRSVEPHIDRIVEYTILFLVVNNQIKRRCIMPDTQRGDFHDVRCSDCGEMGSNFSHWGPLVPKGTVGNLCLFCWTERYEAVNTRGDKPRPLGVKPPGIPQNFLNKKIRVETKSGSVYILTPADKKNEVEVSCDSRNTGFTKARVMCLSVGKSLFLKPRDGDDLGLWQTTPIVSIGY